LGDRKGTAAEQGVPFLVDSEAAGIMGGALESMRLGPGAPGPGDQWKFPTGPVEAGELAAPEPEPAPEPAVRGTGLLRRLTRRRR
jgi:hypothetical protein